jgi:hypothetical protein
MATDEQRNKSNNRAALVAMGVTVGMVSFVMFALVMFCRWWIPRHGGRDTEFFEPCTIALQSIESRVNNKQVDSFLKAIPVKVNDVNGLMLLDTGCNRTMLALDFCKAHTPSGRWVKLNPETTNLSGSHIFYVEEKLTLGNITFERFPFFAFEMEHMTDALDGAPLIGILGTDILNRFNYSINFRDNLLHIDPTEKNMDETQVRIPISIRNHKIYVDMGVQGNTFEFCLDTGSNRATLAEKHLASCQGDVREVKQTWSDINGSHTETVKHTELSDIRLGTIHFKKLVFSVFGDDNLISAPMLKNLTTTIYPAHKYMTLVSHDSAEQNPDVTAIPEGP